MTDKELELKSKLMELKKTNWDIKENKYELALESLYNIGSLDPVLRDELILEFLFNLIVENKLEKDQIKNLLKICMSEDFLFYKIGEKEGDGVFKRSFTALIVRWIVYYQNKIDSSLLTKDEILDIYEKSLNFFKLEKDKRGFVEGKGWADCYSHTGDLLRTLALNTEIDEEKLLNILYLIKDKIAVYDYVFINEEAERLTTAVVYALERNIIKEENFSKWVRSFKNIKIEEKYPEYHYFKENIKNFLRSLYFRLKFKNHNTYLKYLEEVLNDYNNFFNNLDY